MPQDERFLVDVGMKDLPFPMRVISRSDPEGQHTIADISVTARIMQGFEARWIDRFIQILHSHKERIGTETLRENIKDYLNELNANKVEIHFDYPFFVEKKTPISGEACLVRYWCRYSARAFHIAEPRIRFRVEVPAITTYPASQEEKPGGLFGQLSVVAIEVDSEKDIYPEELVELVDQHALAPVFSFLTEEDQAALIEKVHSEKKTSVTMTDELKSALASMRQVHWYSVYCSNFGMLHSYSTIIGTEKGPWVPLSGHEDEEP